MIVAIIGSRKIGKFDIGKYISEDVTEIVSGGAKGVDTLAKVYADGHELRYTEFLPEYEKYGRAAPIKRNDLIINYADKVIAFWDGESKGTKYVIDRCLKTCKDIEVITVSH